MKRPPGIFLATLFFLLTSSYIENRGYDKGSLRPYMEKGRSYKDEAGFKKHQDETKDLFTRAWETIEFQKMLLEAQGNFEGTESRKPTEAEENELEGEVRSIIAGWEIDLVRDLAKEYGNFKAREVAESDTDKGFLAGIFQKIKDFFAPELDKANAVSSDILSNDLSDWRSMVDAGTTAKVVDQKKSLADYYDSLKTGSPLTGDALAAFFDEVDKKRAAEEWAIDRISEMLKEQSFNEYAWRRALEEDIKKGGILVGGTIVRTNDAFLSGESPDKQMVALASGLRSDLDTGLSEILKETGYKLDRVDNAGIQITSLNAQYKKDVAAELERGLNKWNDAEDKLRRAYQEWAARNDANYDQGVRLWQDAFNQFEAAHTAWQQKIGQQITDGDKMWDKAITRLQTEQANAQAELSQFMDEQSQNWSDYFGTLNSDLYSAVQLSAEIQKNRRGFIELIRNASGAQQVNGSANINSLHSLFGYTPYISLAGRISLSGDDGGFLRDPRWNPFDKRISVTVNNPGLVYIDHKYRWVSTGFSKGRETGYWMFDSATPSGGMKAVAAYDKLTGDWAEQYMWLTNYDYTSEGAYFEVQYDEANNSFGYHAWDAGMYHQWIYHQTKAPVADAVVNNERVSHTEDHRLSVDGGTRTAFDDRYFSWYSGLNNLFYYQSQVSSLNTLGAQVADTQSRLFGEYSALLNGSGASEGLFNPGADNQNFYFRTAKEWELYRLEKDLAEAQQNLARKENIRNLSMTPSWSASAQADAETAWKDAEQKYKDAKAAYESKKSEADTYYANAVTSHVSNMAILGSWLSAEGVRVGEANSNYFQAMDAYQDVMTNASSSDVQKDAALAAFRGAQDTYTNAKAGYEASNAVFKTMRATKDDLMKIYYGLLGESDSLYGEVISADHDNQIKRDSFDTIKYVDYLDTNETQAAYLAEQTSYNALKTQRDTAAVAVSSANVYDFFGDAANASLLATEKYKLSELAGWEGRTYQDLWGTEGNGFTSAGIQNFIASRSRGFDIGSVTGNFVRDVASYTSGSDQVTVQLLAYPAETKYWSEEKWVSNMIEVAVKGNNIPLTRSQTIQRGDMVTQVTTRSNTFSGIVSAVTNEIVYGGGDWNVSIRYVSDVNDMLRGTYNTINGSFGDAAVKLMVEGVTNLGLKWNDTKQSFLDSATNRISGIRDKLNANHSHIAQNVSNQIANGVDERRLYGDLSKFYLDNMQMVNGIYGTGNAFGSAQGYLSDLIPTLVTKNKVGQYQSQMDAYSRQINSVLADRDSWQSLIAKIQIKGQNDWQKTYADMVSAFNDWNSRYAEDTYSAKVNWKAKNDDLNAHKYLWAQYATADITEGQRSAYFNELRSTMDAMIGDVLENLPKDVQGDTASLKTKDQALAKMESLIKVQLSQSLANRGDSINTLFANTEVGKLYFVGNQELHARLEKNMEDTERIAINLRNSQMFESVAQSQRARENAINGMNEGTALGLEEQMKNQGYRREGDRWVRRVVIDSSAAGDEYASQYVTVYQNHVHVDVPFTLTLQQILGEVPEVASYLIEKASKGIIAKYEEYMGKESDFDERGDPKDSVYKTAKMFAWVGKAPEFYNGDEKYTVKVKRRVQIAGGRNPLYEDRMVDEEKTRDPMEVKIQGSGEMKQLSYDIRANAISANRGEQARNVPFFAKKLWDDDSDNDGKPDFIAAPNLTTIASIAAAFLPPPINLIASGAIQVSTSIASGVYYGKSAAEIVLDAGKSVALTAIGAATGGLGTGLLGAASTSFLGSIAAAGISSVASSAANTLVGAVNINAGGALSFNTSADYWSKAGENALQSLAISMVGAGVSYGVNTAVGGTMARTEVRAANGKITGYENTWGFGGATANLSSKIAQIGTFVGSMASSAVGAAFGRDFQLNVGGAIDVNLTKVMNGDFSGVIQAGNTGVRVDGLLSGLSAAFAAFGRTIPPSSNGMPNNQTSQSRGVQGALTSGKQGEIVTDNKAPSYDPKDPNYLMHINNLMENEGNLSPSEQAQVDYFRDRFSADSERALLKQYAELINKPGTSLEERARLLSSMSAGQREHAEINDARVQFAYEAAGKSFSTLSPMSDVAWSVLSDSDRANYSEQQRMMHENFKFREAAKSVAEQRMLMQNPGIFKGLDPNAISAGFYAMLDTESGNQQWRLQDAFDKSYKSGDIVTNGTGDWGAGGVNAQWDGKFDFDRIKNDYFYNLDTAAFLWADTVRMAKNDYNQIGRSTTITFIDKPGPFNDDQTFKQKDLDIMGMAYAQYNAGPKVFLNPSTLNMNDFIKNKSLAGWTTTKDDKGNPVYSDPWVSSSLRPYLDSKYLLKPGFQDHDRKYLSYLNSYRGSGQ